MRPLRADWSGHFTSLVRIGHDVSGEDAFQPRVTRSAVQPYEGNQEKRIMKLNKHSARVQLVFLLAVAGLLIAPAAYGQLRRATQVLHEGGADFNPPGQPSNNADTTPPQITCPPDTVVLCPG